ncbi:MAG: NADP-dependent oxidoreductase [Chloroflexi bacterium]|nr:NADP-dependent oxidoreductase [Chloroflexota bacterium]MCC6897242.1 NADP-dependent oxidoreductase [Anaerolineae bacterium]
MKAVRIHQYGDPNVLVYEDAPRPVPQAGEVLVKVHGAGINPVDWKTRAGSGMGSRYGSHPFPLIIGWDLSGEVVELGEGADMYKVGNAVFGMARFPDVGAAYAEYAAVPQHELALKPENITHIEAAAYPLAALTAWQALFETGNLQRGERVLVQGAAGGVGHLAVQIAKWVGAYVIGTGSTANMDFIHELGANEAVDYSTTPFEEAVESIDLVMNCVGGDLLNRSFKVLKHGGRLVSIAGKPDEKLAEQYGVAATSILVRPVERHLDHIAKLIANGELRTTVSNTFPLSEANRAHAFAESRTLRRGKIVLTV